MPKVVPRAAVGYAWQLKILFFNAFIEIFKDFCFLYVLQYVNDYFCQAKDTESKADREHGICLYSKLKPRLLKAVPVKGSVASVFTLKMNGLE